MTFQELLDRTGLSAEEFGVLLTALGMLTTVFVAMVRFGFRRPWRSLRLMFGEHERRFSSRALKLWGTLQDPLSRTVEDIGRRYIPLPLSSIDGDRDLLISVDELLTDSTVRNIIIVGDAGSGKSTLLKAFAVTALRAGKRGWGVVRGRPAPLPFFVQLRQFAVDGRWDDPNPLLSYIREQLRIRFQLDEVESSRMLGRALARHRLIVLLDGLDEVRDTARERIRQAIDKFRRDGSAQCPTAAARLVLTCREHNFEAIKRLWVATVIGDPDTGEVARDSVYSLARLRDADIKAYLELVRDKFSDPQEDTRRYLTALYQSPTLDMHRIPLVLAASVSYYTTRKLFDIPSEIGELYKRMVTEMVTRHDFPEPGAQVQSFKAADKEQFLREFAAANAIPSIRNADEIDFGESFGAFDKQALYALAERLQRALDDVKDHEAFVNEILDHSGLLKSSGDRHYEFAHRTLQEYLVADHLRAQKAGDDLLLRHAQDDTWQQIVIFYADTPALSKDKVDDFLLRLAEQNIELAGHCMRAAKPSNETADSIIDRLVIKVRQRDQQMTPHLNALLSTTLSPRSYIREQAVKAVNALLDEIIDDFDAFELLGRNVDSVVHLLEALSRTRAGHIAALVPKVISAVPNDPRLVPALWHCLQADGISAYDGVKRIVERLIGLVTDEDCFKQLQSLPPGNSPFATPQRRAKVYPFGSELRQSNLVELLCWLDYLKIDVVEPNRYLVAMREAGEQFATVEADHSRTTRVQLFPVGWLLSAGGLAAAIAYLPTAGWQRLAWSLESGMLWWLALAPLLAATVFITMFSWAERGHPAGFAHRHLRSGEAPGVWRSGNLVAELCARLPNTLSQLVFLASSALPAVALAPMLTMSLVGYVAAATTATGLVVWLPLMALFDRGRRIYLKRPNVYTDIYDDRYSQHWLPQPKRAPSRPRPANGVRP